MLLLGRTTVSVPTSHSLRKYSSPLPIGTAGIVTAIVLSTRSSCKATPLWPPLGQPLSRLLDLNDRLCGVIPVMYLHQPISFFS